MSDYRFGVGSYGLNYYPHDGVHDEHEFIDWSKVERVEIDWVDFVRERTCKMRADGAHCMNGVEFYECRSCGEYACIPTVMGKSEPPNYCPNCGAKVVGE